MSRPRRIAVEPKPASGNGASGASLLHKRAGHQRHLIHQHSRKGDALDQACRAFVPSAENIKLIPVAAKSHRHQVFRPFFLPFRPQRFQPRQDLRQHISSQRRDGFSADAEPLPIKTGHRPQKEPKTHSQCLPGAHRPIADNGFLFMPYRSRHPPGKHCPLLF